MGLHSHKLPATLIPNGDICVPVFIPNDPDYIALFVRAVRQLETDRLYERDENYSSNIVTEQWRTRTVSPLIDALASASGETVQVRRLLKALLS